MLTELEPLLELLQTGVMLWVVVGLPLNLMNWWAWCDLNVGTN
jgi:hypothetical protein